MGPIAPTLVAMTTLPGDYEPSPSEWVRDQIAEYEASGGQRANTLRDTGLAIVVVTSRGARSGNVRKNPVMRVEYDGDYAIVASKGGAAENPEWYSNLVAHPNEVTIQDGPEPFAVDRARSAWEGAGIVVGSGYRRLSPLCRVSGEDGEGNPRLHRRPPRLS